MFINVHGIACVYGQHMPVQFAAKGQISARLVCTLFAANISASNSSLLSDVPCVVPRILQTVQHQCVPVHRL